MPTIVDIPESRLRRADRIALKARLGLALAAEESAFVGRLRLRTTFKREEAIEMLGFVDPKGKLDPIPRMLPVDVALGRLGLAVVRALPDGTAEELRKEFPKAWAARERADRAIALHVAKTYVEVPEGWYPDRARLMMVDRVGDAARAAGVPDIGPGARVLLEDAVPFLRLDLLPADLRLAGYQMWHRRRLAGIEPMVGDGLVYGFWDPVLNGYDVAARSLRGGAMALLAIRAMLLRDGAVACFCEAGPGAAGRAAYYDGPYSAMYEAFASKLANASRVGPGEPARSYGGGLARLHRLELARPGAAWSARPVGDRPERLFDVRTFRISYPQEVDPAQDPDALPAGYAPGGVMDPPWTDWAGRFASA